MRACRRLFCNAPPIAPSALPPVKPPPPKPKIQVAVVGSGPSGCYVADYLIKKHPDVHCDIYEKLPVPFGLVRYGVAPDHPEVKNVEKKFTELFRSGRCTLLTNIHIGKEITVEQLRSNYQAVVIAAGASDDRRLKIRGELLRNVVSARRFVEFYNTMPHPYGSPLNGPVDLKNGAKRALIIGNGNVAIDCARVLGAHYKRFCPTDMNCFAVRELMESTVRDVSVVARRGAEHSAFTIKEFRELTTIQGLQTVVDHFDLEKAIHEAGDTRPNRRKLELVHKFCGDLHAIEDKDARVVNFRFGLAPVEFLPSPEDKRAVGACVFRVNPSTTRLPQALSFARPFFPSPDAMQPDALGSPSPYLDPNDKYIVAPCDLVLKSAGYISKPFRGVPYDEQNGTILHKGGRVSDMKRVYCAGWIKTGAKGVILGSMMDANETAATVLYDLDAGIDKESTTNRGKFGLLEFMAERELLPFSLNSVEKVWKHETEKGIDLGKKSEKIGMIQDMKDIMLGGKTARRAADRFRGRSSHRPRGLEIVEDWLDEDTELVNPAGMLEFRP